MSSGLREPEPDFEAPPARLSARRSRPRGPGHRRRPRASAGQPAAVDRRDRADPAAPGSANGVVFITIEDETGIANLIVWPAILERFRRAALGATLLRCTGKLQREEGVIHVVADRLEDMTPRLSTLRDRTGCGEPERAPKPPFASSAKPPGYDPRDIVVASHNFR